MNPCKITVHTQEKKKRGRKRGHSKTPGNAQAKHSLRRLREKEKGDEDESKFFLLRSGLTGY